MGEVIREIGDTHVNQIRSGEYALLPLILSHPEVVGRATETVQKNLFLSLLGVIGDTRGLFTTGVKKESATAMRILTNLIASYTETSSLFKSMMRQVGSEEIKKLRLDRHLVSSKADVGPSALEFIRVVLLVLCCRPSDILEADATIQRVEEILGPQINSMLARHSAAGSEGSQRRRSHTQPPANRPEAVDRRNRQLPSKCKGERPPFNPLYRSGVECSLLDIQSPEPVLFFAKHFGLGCVPRIAKWSQRGPVPSESISNAVSGYKPSKQGGAASELVGAQPQPSPVDDGVGGSPAPALTRQTSGSVYRDPSGMAGLSSPGGVQGQSNTSTPGSSTTPSGPTFPPVVAASGAGAPGTPAPASATSGATTAPTSAATPSSPAGPSPHFQLPEPPEPGTEGHALLTRYLLSEGITVGWGSARMGELGCKMNTNVKLTPRILQSLLPQRLTRLAGGSQFTLLTSTTGQLQCTGAGEWGQLGVGDPSVALTDLVDGEIPVRYGPTTIKGFKPNDRITAFTAGYAFAIALSHKGEMYLWGNNNHGQCSVGAKPTKSTIRVLNPVKVAMKGSRIVNAACGSFFVVALTDAHTVLSWGLVSLLGLGPEDDVLAQIDQQWVGQSLSKEKRNVAIHPCKVSALEGKKIVKLAAGQWHVIAISAEGPVYSWGIGHQGRLGHGTPNSETRPKRISALKDVPILDGSCGSFHTALLAKDGSVYCCGDNASGQCGLVSATATTYLVPTKVPGFGREPDCIPAIAIECGREHTLVLTADGDLYSFGSGCGAGLGLGTRLRSPHPRRIVSTLLTLSMSCGVAHSFALGLRRTTDLLPCGTLHCGDQRMSAIRLPEGLVQAALGASFTVLLDRNGDVYTFGNGDWGQLGVGPLARIPERKVEENIPYVPTPVRVGGLSKHKVSAISAGYAFAYAITEAQQVFFWGNNNHCQSGLGLDYKNHLKVEEPKENPFLSKLEVVQIACGSFFVLALTTSGEVYGWGLLDCCGVSDLGPEGSTALTTSATTEKRSVLSVPMKVEGLAGVISLATGQWHSLALCENGAIYSWGVGHQGRLGHGNSNSLSKPFKIMTNALFVSIDCGSFNSCAISTTGQLYMWGDNESGQCGIEGQTTLLTPTPVFSGVRSAACGRQHTALCTKTGDLLLTGIIQQEGQVYQSTIFAFPSHLFAPFDQPATFRRTYTALEVYSGPHHMILLAEQSRPSSEGLTAASIELRSLCRRTALETPAEQGSAPDGNQGGRP